MSRKRYLGDIYTIIDQEEYIWAMRTSAYDQMVLRERGSLSADSEDILIEPDKYSPHMMLIHKTTILASFVPDEIILNVNDYSTKTFDACILSGDVSGFTELCETYNQIGSGGPTRLTDTLNNFIGAMAQEIISRGGDIIKFSGDAFLGLWKCSKNQDYTMRDYIQEAINCALIIQKNHNNFKTDVGVTLKVKLGISSGAFLFSLIGDSAVSHYIEVGQPILDSKEILELCRAGDIIITEKAYAYVDSSAYVTECLLNGRYVRIFGVGPSWRQTQKFLQQQAQTKVSEEADSDTSLSSRTSMFNRRHSSEFARKSVSM
ncbi:hypothetical protein WA026_011277 [Henosepilachna vigintioctopunctata]|uniref:Guanylate cyclase domain-containing protein n=1 Tax=Henosepilachna vigintioctopunctata TaxID=420089 RepID=A0AAW1TX44_9CUCU